MVFCQPSHCNGALHANDHGCSTFQFLLCARYKPEVAKAVESLPKRTPDGLDVDIAAELDKDVKVGLLAAALHPCSCWPPALMCTGVDTAAELDKGSKWRFHELRGGMLCVWLPALHIPYS